MICFALRRRTTENQRRKSLALFTEVQKRRNSNTMDSEAYTVPPSPHNSLDGPLQIALDQLRRATKGDASTQRLINKLVTVGLMLFRFAVFMV